MSFSSKMPDGRTVYGSAAQQHIIKMNGGWDEHHRKFAEKVADIALKEYSKELSKQSVSIVQPKQDQNIG